MFLRLHGVSNGRLDRILQAVNCQMPDALQVGSEEENLGVIYALAVLKRKTDLYLEIYKNVVLF